MWDICGVGSVPDDSVDHGTAEEILPDRTIIIIFIKVFIVFFFLFCFFFSAHISRNS